MMVIELKLKKQQDIFVSKLLDIEKYIFSIYNIWRTLMIKL